MSTDDREKHYAFSDALTLMIPDTPPLGAAYSCGSHPDMTDWVQTVNALRTYARGGHYAPNGAEKVMPGGIYTGFFGITEETFVSLRTLIYGE